MSASESGEWRTPVCVVVCDHVPRFVSLRSLNCGCVCLSACITVWVSEPLCLIVSRRCLWVSVRPSVAVCLLRCVHDCVCSACVEGREGSLAATSASIRPCVLRPQNRTGLGVGQRAPGWGWGVLTSVVGVRSGPQHLRLVQAAAQRTHAPRTPEEGVSPGAECAQLFHPAFFGPSVLEPHLGQGGNCELRSRAPSPPCPGRPFWVL